MINISIESVRKMENIFDFFGKWISPQILIHKWVFFK